MEDNNNSCYVVVFVNNEAIYSSFVTKREAIKQLKTKQKEFKLLYPLSDVKVEIVKKEPFLGW